MAGGFRFRYQNVLDVRARQQRGLEVELAGADRRLRRARRALAELEGSREENLQQARAARERADLDENRRCADYLRHLRRQIEAARRQIAALGEQREDVRRRLQRMMQSRKVLEKYRDRLRAEFEAEQEKNEERAVDLHTAWEYARAGGAQ